MGILKNLLMVKSFSSNFRNNGNNKVRNIPYRETFDKMNNNLIAYRNYIKEQINKNTKN